MSRELLHRIAVAYLWSHGRDRSVGDLLGYGQDGHVWCVVGGRPGSAIKVFERKENYERESAAYSVLSQHHVECVAGLSVPQCRILNQRLCVVEMSIVEPPFLLDFGKAYTNDVPPYINDPDIMGEFWSKHESQFTGDEWDNVHEAMQSLSDLGIWHGDPNCLNIQFSSGATLAQG